MNSRQYIHNYLQLTDYQKHIIKENGTEIPYSGEYHDLFDRGIYVDLLSGDVLFLSCDKINDKSGWPVFSQAAYEDSIVILEVELNGFKCREVRSNRSDCHLGIEFIDKKQNTGKKYCLNSRALKFIPYEEMKEKGYKDWMLLVEE